MIAPILRIIRARNFWGLYLVNFIFQKVLRVTSQRVNCIHFTNSITADNGFKLTGHGNFAELCLRVNGGILIQASNGVFLDRSTLLAPGVKIVSGNHDLDDFSKPASKAEPLVISENCWLGANCVILPGVKLHPGTIVGAGSVVTKSFGIGNIVVAGNPARIVGYRK